MTDTPPRRGRLACRPPSRVFPTAERLVYSPLNYRVVLVVDALGALVFLLLGLWLPASPAARVSSAVAGFAAWGFLEYAIHRWVGHGRPSIARRGHAEHHSDDTALIAAPMCVVLIGAFAGWAILSVVVPSASASLFVFGAYLGYNHYAFVHHVLHHHEAFVGSLGLRRLERRHRIHHAQQNVNFGVTSALWDRALGTYDSGADTRVRPYAAIATVHHVDIVGADQRLQPLVGVGPHERDQSVGPAFSRTTRSYETSSSHNPSATSCE